MKKEIICAKHLSANAPIPFKNINMTIYENEIIGISGLNDYSYSYFADILTQHFPITHGELLFSSDPEDMKIIDVHAAYFENVTVAEAICLLNNKKQSGFVNWKTIKKNAEMLLADYEVHIPADKYLKELSSIDILIIKVLAAIYLNKKTFLFPHLFDTFSFEMIQKLLCFLKKLQEKKICTVIILSSDLESLMKICDRIYLFSNGFCLYCLTPSYYMNREISQFLVKTASTKNTVTASKSSDILLQIQGQTIPDSPPFELKIPKGSLVGIFDMDNSICTDLGQNLYLGKNSSWFFAACKYMNSTVTEKNRQNFGYISADSLQTFFPKLSLKDNLARIIHESPILS